MNGLLKGELTNLIRYVGHIGSNPKKNLALCDRTEEIFNSDPSLKKEDYSLDKGVESFKITGPNMNFYIFYEGFPNSYGRTEEISVYPFFKEDSSPRDCENWLRKNFSDFL